MAGHLQNSNRRKFANDFSRAGARALRDEWPPARTTQRVGTPRWLKLLHARPHARACYESRKRESDYKSTKYGLRGFHSLLTEAPKRNPVVKRESAIHYDCSRGRRVDGASPSGPFLTATSLSCSRRPGSRPNRLTLR